MRNSFPAIVLLLWLASCKTTSVSKQVVPQVFLDSIEINVPRDYSYRAAAPKIFDLIHTKLEVSFNWQHQWLFGKATVSLHPHFYDQHTLDLDAKNMDIYEVQLLEPSGSKPLSYTYDSLQLHLELPKVYHTNDTLTVFIQYKSKPNERKSGGSAAITDDKGLYFINPLGEDSGKPQQIWTQGETESASYWFPTLDHPNQKSTEEIFITVDKKYTTLSNGLLISQKENGDLRTDYWRMDLPHSPYLFMMAIGIFDITKDNWRGRDVWYYTEPKYSYMARRIFGETPLMMEFFTKKLGVDYPWPKYSQVVARDYVSGAMENTTATLHSEVLNRDSRQIIDEDFHDYVSHELFHQWFGDYVTAESWSNLTLNESFANYAEYIWNEHRYGRDEADRKGQHDFLKYLGETRGGKSVDLVRFYYNDREDMFDAHSYEKGGRILHMLRNLVGDEAFYASLQLYLKTYAFKNAEAHQLRLAFEQITGRDLNWFFNQWYYDSGHPVVEYSYNTTADSVFVTATQHQSTGNGRIYELPLRIAVYYNNQREVHDVIWKKRSQTFAFKNQGSAKLIDADADRILLCEKTENKTTANYVFQYLHGERYMQRREALDSLKRRQRNSFEATEVFRKALADSSAGIRAFAAEYIRLTEANKDTVMPLLKDRAKNDKESLVRKEAITTLAKLENKSVLPEVKAALGDSSYQVEAAALKALSKLDSAAAATEAHRRENSSIAEIKTAVAAVYETSGDTAFNQWYLNRLHKEKGYQRLYGLYYYANYLCRAGGQTALNGIDSITSIGMQQDDPELPTYASGAIERVRDYFMLKRQQNFMAMKSKDASKNYDLQELQRELAMCARITEQADERIKQLSKEK
ncbi:MAG: M1 family aminopeptidase [Chitinophagales bacterium]